MDKRLSALFGLQSAYPFLAKGAALITRDPSGKLHKIWFSSLTSVERELLQQETQDLLQIASQSPDLQTLLQKILKGD